MNNWQTRIELARLWDWNCFESYCWDAGAPPLSRKAVAYAVKHELFEERAFDEVFLERLWKNDVQERRWHVRRVAYLVVHPSLDPIEIDVGIPGRAPIEWIVEDGNHRLTAAFYRGDRDIEATISGSVSYAEELLGVRYLEVGTYFCCKS